MLSFDVGVGLQNGNIPCRVFIEICETVFMYLYKAVVHVVQFVPNCILVVNYIKDTYKMSLKLLMCLHPRSNELQNIT
jgi:hypothetical protein